MIDQEVSDVLKALTGRLLKLQDRLDQVETTVAVQVRLIADLETQIEACRLRARQHARGD